MKSVICVVEKTKIVKWGFPQFSKVSLSNGTQSVAMVLQWLLEVQCFPCKVVRTVSVLVPNVSPLAFREVPQA